VNVHFSNHPRSSILTGLGRERPPPIGFYRQTAGRVWYGPLARFDSAADMLAYLKDMHQLVQRHLVHDWKEQSGHRARDVTDPDCL
jgi:hypothetical protein